MCYDCPNVDQSEQCAGHSVSTYGVVTIYFMMSTNQSFGQVPPPLLCAVVSYVSVVSDTHFELLPYLWAVRDAAFLGWLNSINTLHGSIWSGGSHRWGYWPRPSFHPSADNQRKTKNYWDITEGWFRVVKRDDFCLWYYHHVERLTINFKMYIIIYIYVTI